MSHPKYSVRQPSNHWLGNDQLRSEVARGLRSVAERLEGGKVAASTMKFFVSQSKVFGMTDEIANDPNLTQRHLSDRSNWFTQEAEITVDCTGLERFEG